LNLYLWFKEHAEFAKKLSFFCVEVSLIVSDGVCATLAFSDEDVSVDFDRDKVWELLLEVV